MANVWEYDGDRAKMFLDESEQRFVKGWSEAHTLTEQEAIADIWERGLGECRAEVRNGG